MNNKLWAGRFSKELSSVADDFNSSIPFDSRMYMQDIRGSIAHATMLGMQGIITIDEAHKIINELVKIEEDITEGRLEIDMSAEDIHMFVESVLTERIGDTGKKLHTARSRNDQVAVDIRLYLKDETDEIISNICSLIEALTNKADEYKEAIMPGYTHMQRAQPITFGHHLMAYVSMFTRDIERLSEASARTSSGVLLFLKENLLSLPCKSLFMFAQCLKTIKTAIIIAKITGIPGP